MDYKSINLLTEGHVATIQLNRPERKNAVSEEMYLELQKIIQAESPIMIMFQASYQVGMNNAVTGYVNGATSDFVFYRLVEKN